MFVAHNTIQAIFDYYQDGLKNIYPVDEVEAILYIVFEHHKNWSKIETKMNFNKGLSESELLTFHNVLKRLKKMEPIQHILGVTEFYGLPFYVNENVLIPRQETEELVDLILKNCKGNEVILDIGTGSGIIPISLKNEMPKATLSGLDVSDEALIVANKNAKLNNTEVGFFHEDVLKLEDFKFINGEIDVVVSNPPYITHKEKKLMHENVLNFDPALALFVADNDPLIFYRKITEIASKALKKGGQLFFEINENYGSETVDLIKTFTFEKVSLLKDLNEKDRMIHAIK